MIVNIEAQTQTVYNGDLTVDGKGYRFEVIQHCDAIRNDHGDVYYASPRFDVYRDEMKLLPRMIPRAVEEIIELLTDNGGFKLSENANA
jgi:hypothetical protein